MVRRLTVMSDDEGSMSADNVPLPPSPLPLREKRTMKRSMKQSQSGLLSFFQIFVPV